MADSAIGSLPAVQIMQNADLFVLEQNGEAMKLSGELLASFIDRQIVSVTVVERAATETYTVTYNRNTGELIIGIPRGVGISNISNPVVSGLNKTYTIIFDKPASASVATTKDFTVKDGNGIVSIEAINDAHVHGGMDHYRINFDEGSPFDFYVYNGQDGYGTPGDATPFMDGTASVGVANMYSRQDHIHPTDTSRQAKKLIFENKSVTSWENDPESLFLDYPKRGVIACPGVLTSMFPIVVLAPEDAESGDYAPNSKCGNEVVYIYATDTPSTTVTVKSVTVLP